MCEAIYYYPIKQKSKCITDKYHIYGFVFPDNVQIDLDKYNCISWSAFIKWNQICKKEKKFYYDDWILEDISIILQILKRDIDKVYVPKEFLPLFIKVDNFLIAIAPHEACE